MTSDERKKANNTGCISDQITLQETGTQPHQGSPRDVEYSSELCYSMNDKAKVFILQFPSILR